MNPKVQHLKNIVKEEELEVTPLTEEELQKVLEFYPNAPEDYLTLLKEVGAGNYGFIIYNNLMDPDDIFDSETSKTLTNYKFFGDDMSGWMFGYDTSKTPWEVLIFNHSEPLPNSKEDKTEILSFLIDELTRD